MVQGFVNGPLSTVLQHFIMPLVPCPFLRTHALLGPQLWSGWCVHGGSIWGCNPTNGKYRQWLVPQIHCKFDTGFYMRDFSRWLPSFWLTFGEHFSRPSDISWVIPFSLDSFRDPTRTPLYRPHLILFVNWRIWTCAWEDHPFSPPSKLNKERTECHLNMWLLKLPALL